MDDRETAPIAARTIVRARPEHVSANLDDETVILGLERGQYYGLKGVGVDVWAMLKNARSVDSIKDAITREYDVSPERCLADLIPYLEQLRSEGLLEVVAP